MLNFKKEEQDSNTKLQIKTEGKEGDVKTAGRNRQKLEEFEINHPKTEVENADIINELTFLRGMYEGRSNR